MGRDAKISWYRTILCSLKTGRKYFGSLLNSQCEKTNEKTLCKVLGENAYKHKILHLWKGIRCCLCGPSTKHSSSGSLNEKQVLILYFLTHEHCGTDNCKLCTKSYQAKENISTSRLDITLSRALLKGVFAKSLTDILHAAIDAITNVRNTAIHMAEEEMETFEFDKEWLTLKKNLVIICEHLNKPTEDLEDELESYYRLFNSCESCSKYMEVPCAGFTSRLTDASDDEILMHFKTLNDCPDCKGIREGCHDARSLFLDNLPLFMGLHPDEFLPDLKENKVLSEDEYSAIEIPEERVGQMGVFISIMTKKSLSEFRRTLDILSAKDYGSKIREMRKDKKRKIHYSVGSDVKDTRGFQNDNEDTNMEQQAAAIEISFTGQRNGDLEKKTEEILHRDSFSSALKDMGPSVFETTKGSVIIKLRFERKAGYDTFCKAAYNGKLLEYMSALWDRIKTEEPSACQDAMIMVFVKNLTDKPQGPYTLRGKTGTSSSFIDANHDYLIEELNPRPLMKQLKEDGYDTTNVCKIRKENPFDRRSQAFELLKTLRQVHWHYLTECFKKTQPKSLRKKMDQFISSKGIELPSSSKHINEEMDVFPSDSSPESTKESPGWTEDNLANLIHEIESSLKTGHITDELRSLLNNNQEMMSLPSSEKNQVREKLEGIVTNHFKRNLSSDQFSVTLAVSDNSFHFVVLCEDHTFKTKADQNWITFVMVNDAKMESIDVIPQRMRNPPSDIDKKKLEEFMNTESHSSLRNTLFEEHSNLNSVSFTKGKSINYGSRDWIITDEICVVLQCFHKGYIPFGESPFPSKIGNYRTDVREGHCSLSAGPKVQMGKSVYTKSINKKSCLGNFVQFEDGSNAFITCAHVFFPVQDLRNISSLNGYLDTEVYDTETHQKIGSVTALQFHCNIGESVDAALVVLDHNTEIEPGFPTIHMDQMQHAGFLLQPLCISSTALEIDNSNIKCYVVKYGPETHLTVGTLELGFISCKPFNWDITENIPTSSRDNEPLIMRDQILINPCEKDFLQQGDSGSFVFMVDDQEKALKCIGMLIGQTSSGQGIMTPIHRILKMLNITKLKSFPQRVQLQTTFSNPMVEMFSRIQVSMNSLHEKVNSMDNKFDIKMDELDRRVRSLESESQQNLTKKMDYD